MAFILLIVVRTHIFLYSLLIYFNQRATIWHMCTYATTEKRLFGSLLYYNGSVEGIPVLVVLDRNGR